MRNSQIMPTLDAHAPAEPRAHKARALLPGCNEDRGRVHCKLTDREVIALILAHLRGEAIASIRARTGLEERTLRQWMDGVNRRRCFHAADRIRRQELNHAARGA